MQQQQKPPKPRREKVEVVPAVPEMVCGQWVTGWVVTMGGHVVSPMVDKRTAREMAKEFRMMR